MGEEKGGIEAPSCCLSCLHSPPPPHPSVAGILLVPTGEVALGEASVASRWAPSTPGTHTRVCHRWLPGSNLHEPVCVVLCWWWYVGGGGGHLLGVGGGLAPTRRGTFLAALGEHDLPLPQFRHISLCPPSPSCNVCVSSSPPPSPPAPQLFLFGGGGGAPWAECPPAPLAAPPHVPISPPIWGGDTHQSPLHHGCTVALPPPPPTPNPAQPSLLGGWVPPFLPLPPPPGQWGAERGLRWGGRTDGTGTQKLGGSRAGAAGMRTGLWTRGSQPQRTHPPTQDPHPDPLRARAAGEEHPRFVGSFHMLYFSSQKKK